MWGNHMVDILVREKVELQSPQSWDNRRLPSWEADLEINQQIHVEINESAPGPLTLHGCSLPET